MGSFVSHLLGDQAKKTNVVSALTAVESDPEIQAMPQLVLTTDQKRLIIETWTVVSSHDNANRLGILIFNILMQRPDVKLLFPFRHLNHNAMQHDRLFKAHSGRFAQIIVAVIQEIKAELDKNDSVDVPTQGVDAQIWSVGLLLRSLGKSHVGNKLLTVIMFKEIAETSTLQAMLQVWQASITDGSWTKEVAIAWECLFKQIINQVYIGYVIAWKDKMVQRAESRVNLGFQTVIPVKSLLEDHERHEAKNPEYRERMELAKVKYEAARHIGITMDKIGVQIARWILSFRRRPNLSKMENDSTYYYGSAPCDSVQYL